MTVSAGPVDGLKSVAGRADRLLLRPAGGSPSGKGGRAGQRLTGHDVPSGKIEPAARGLQRLCSARSRFARDGQ